MRKYSLPCIISLVVAALYNIVDQIFIANTDYLGSYGNAANTVVFPLKMGMMGSAVATVAGQILTPVREIIFGVFLPILLPRFFGLDGVLCSFPPADVLAFILTVAVILKVFTRTQRKKRFGKTDNRSKSKRITRT